MTVENVIIEVLDKKFDIDEFVLSNIDKTLFKWELGGLTDPIGQLINWLWGNIQEAFSGLANDIWGWLNTIKSNIIETLGSSISSIGNIINTVASGLESAINNIGSTLNSFLSSIESDLSSLQNVLTQIGANLAGLANQIVSGVQGVVQEVIQEIQSISESLSGLAQSIVYNISSLGSQIYNYLDSFGHELYSAITGIEKAIVGELKELFTFLGNMEKQFVHAISELPSFISHEFSEFGKWLSNVFKTVSTSFLQLEKMLQSFSTVFIRGFSDLGKAIDNVIGGIREGITKFLTNIREFITKQYNNLMKGVHDIGIALSGFINPLVEIKNWIYSNLALFSEITKNPLSVMVGFTSLLFTDIEKILEDAWNTINTIKDWLENVISNFVTGLFSNLTNVIINTIYGSFGEASELIEKIPEHYNPFQSLKYVAKGYSSELVDKIAFVVILEALAESIGEQVIELTPFGIGGKIKLKLQTIFKHIAKFMREIGEDIVKYGFAAFAFWSIEPTRRYIYKAMRNEVPVELPSLHEIIEFARRHMPLKNFKDFIDKAKEVLAFRGFSDWVINAFLTSPEQEAVIITDRFGRKRTFPTALLYEIPTHSELCNMMMHDIIINVNDFIKAMQMSGVHPDIAYLFYLLHFRYMTLDKLWEFYCRGLAGMLRIDNTYLIESEEQMIANGLGFKPSPPVQFNGQNANRLLPALAQYAKWHNYAFFAWQKGLPSDRLIALELLAKIPERIDSRWLYKWGLIDDTDVEKIIIARGYHKDWVENLTIAECMNALSEERSYARTGVLSSFEKGFLTESEMESLLNNLTNVKILDKSVPVKYLEGEIKLLAIRGKYDRAIKLLDGLSYALIDGFKENIVEWDEVTKLLYNATNELAKGLGITLTFDESFYKLYFPIANSMKTIYTVKRIRYWLRYLLMEIVRRFERGYLNETELDEIISSIQKWAALTNEEKEALEDIAKFMLTLFNREIEAKAILKRLSRGVITINEAKRELIKLGLNENIAQSMIDYYAKTYTLSPSSLVELSEYVPIPETELKEKLEVVGMPKDEMKIYPAYAFARQVASYIRRMVTELIDDYADGIITLQELERELNNLATMNGQVKRRFGIDWIVLSPDERKLIIELAKLKRERKLKRKTAR